MNLNIKIAKVFFLLMITFLLTTSNIYSQDLQHNFELGNKAPSPMINLNRVNYRSKILNENSTNRHFAMHYKNDSGSNYVIDSVITVRGEGIIAKYSYSFDMSGKRKSSLCEEWIENNLVSTRLVTCTYDVDENLIGILLEEMKNGVWSNYSRTTKEYDSNGNVISDLYEKWYEVKWYNVTRKTYTYDSNGNRTSYAHESWRGTERVVDYRITYVYNSNNKVIILTYGEWDGNNWKSGKTWRYTYSYDYNGNETSSLEEELAFEDWVNISKTTNIYDSNGNNTYFLYQRWNGSDWINQSCFTSTFNSDGEKTSEFSQKWNGTSWINRRRDTYRLDFNGKLISHLEERWRDGNWKNANRNTNSYDYNGNKIFSLSENWKDSDWKNSSRIFYNYDINENFTGGLCESWSDGEWIKREGMFIFVDSFGNTYTHSGTKVDAFYRKISEVVNTNLVYSLSQNYPNPFNPSTTIKYQISSNVKGETANVNLKVYDILGREVATLVNKEQSAGNYEVQFNASSLTSGIYFYQLKAGSFIESKKMLLLQ
ncbi:MAG: T9SS type A sorting domain-containing protein [Chlorobi bacterium]|nr:T9SS type A sorting domain-containing protein [Chlorobiota bacterium]